MVTPLDKLVDATEALEPGLKKGEMIQSPSLDSVSPDGEEISGRPGMVVSDLISAGWTTIYHTLTGEPSLCNNNALTSQLRLRRDPQGNLLSPSDLGGVPVFTLVEPKGKAWRGNVKCLLHPSQPDRDKFNSMGFPVCRKETIPNMFQLEEHMSHKHSREWRTLERDREELERIEDRNVQRAIAKAFSQGNLEEVRDIVPEDLSLNSNEVPAPVESTANHERISEGKCVCGKTFNAGKRMKADYKLALHIRRSV